MDNIMCWRSGQISLWYDLRIDEPVMVSHDGSFGQVLRSVVHVWKKKLHTTYLGCGEKAFQGYSSRNYILCTVNMCKFYNSLNFSKSHIL